MANAPENDQLSERETKRRAEAALKKMLATPPKPFTPQPKGKRKPSPGPPKQRIQRHQGR